MTEKKPEMTPDSTKPKMRPEALRELVQASVNWAHAKSGNDLVGRSAALLEAVKEYERSVEPPRNVCNDCGLPRLRLLAPQH